MPLLRALFYLTTHRLRTRLLQGFDNPAAAQADALRRILTANTDTRFGREHGFASIRDWDTYRAQVPIRRYEDFLPYLEPMKQGEANILTAAPVELFTQTSGTSAAPKFLPVTRPFTIEHHQAHLFWMNQLLRDRPGNLIRRFLSIVSPAESDTTPGGIPVGSSSGYQYRHQSIPIRRMHAVPYDVFTVADAAARYHMILLFALRRDLSAVTSVNPSTLVVLADVLRTNAEALLEDLEAGVPRHAPGLSEAECSLLAPLLRPEPARAKSLRERMRHDGALLPRNAWPGLVSLHTWQGGSAPYYLGKLPALWGDIPQRCLGLRASEGTCSIPLRDHTASGVVHVCGHALEFVQGEGDIRPDTPTCLAHELETGKRYRVILSTGAGLYRYDLGDMVEVTGRFRNTPEIAFLHKAGNVLSLTGEKVTEDQVVDVMARAAGIIPPTNGFTVTLELTDPPRYVLALECPEPLPSEVAERVLQRFDEDLSGVNVEYRDKRASQRLAPPCLLLLAPGSYMRYRSHLQALGRPDGQIKPPHLVRPAGEGAAPVPGCPFFDHVTVQGRFPG